MRVRLTGMNVYAVQVCDDKVGPLARSGSGLGYRSSSDPSVMMCCALLFFVLAGVLDNVCYNPPSSFSAYLGQSRAYLPTYLLT